MSRALRVAVVVVILSVTVVAQSRGGGGGGAGGMRPGQGQQRGYGQGMGMGTGPGNSTQSQARTAQQDRYRECSQATSRLRQTLRKLSRLQTGVALSADQARRYREQLRQQLQLLLQERTDWLNAFTEEQTTEAQPEIASSANEVQKLQDLVDIMDLELGEESANTEKVRENAAKAEAAVQRVEQEQGKVETKISSTERGQ